MPFNPKEHMSKLKGKDYLEVKWRLVWFREDHPIDTGWALNTEIVQYDDKRATIHAKVIDPEGRIVATGTKSETPSGFADYLEKAETGSIGRALAACGYGTQFAPELEEGPRIVDSPVTNANTSSQTPPPQPPSAQPTPPKQAEPKKPDEPHPNKTKITEALCKSIYIAGSKVPLDNDAVKDYARGLFEQPDLVSLYDLGKEREPYMRLLEALSKMSGGNT